MIGRPPSVLGFFPLLPLLRYLLISFISTAVSYTMVYAATWWWAPYSDKEPREDAKSAEMASMRDELIRQGNQGRSLARPGAVGGN